MATITQLPLDLKGTLSSNEFRGEVHTLTKASGRTNRMFSPKYGAYYKDSLEVRDSTGKVLVEGTHYATTYYYDDIWDLTAKSACAIIVITDASVTNTVRISYRALGGHYCLSVDELKAVLAEIDEYPDDLGWDDIRNKPLQFSPDDHTHEMWQLYGMESTVVNLDMIATAWAAGRKGILDDNRYYYRNVIDLAEAAVTEYTAKVMAHINARNNPHLTDKVKIGLGDINNWAMANVMEGNGKTVNNKYQPIGSVFDQLTTHVLPLLDAHVKNTSNPHRVSLDDPLLNVYSTSTILSKLNARLARTEAAYSSALYEGNTTTAIYNAVRTGFNVSAIDANTRMPQDRMAAPIAGWNPLDYVLAGDNTYKPITSLVSNINTNTSGVTFIGSAALSSYMHLPVGSYAIRSVFQDFNDRRASYTLSVHMRINGGTGWQQMTK